MFHLSENDGGFSCLFQQKYQVQKHFNLFFCWSFFLLPPYQREWDRNWRWYDGAGRWMKKEEILKREKFGVEWNQITSSRCLPPLRFPSWWSQLHTWRPSPALCDAIVAQKVGEEVFNNPQRWNNQLGIWIILLIFWALSDILGTKKSHWPDLMTSLISEENKNTSRTKYANRIKVLHNWYLLSQVTESD